MHSSRMRTGRSLTVCLSLLPGGVSDPGGVSSKGGVCSQGGVCSGEVSDLGGVCSKGGVCSQGGVCSGEVSAPGGCLLWGGFLLWGVSAQGGCGGIPACTEADNPPLPVDRITDACKNITLAQLRCGR